MTLPTRTLRTQFVLFAGLLALLPVSAPATSDRLDDPEAAPIQAVGTLELESTDDIEAEPEGLQIIDAAEVDLDAFLWEWRVVAVLADTPSDPAFIQQMRDIVSRASDLHDRDVIVVVDSARDSGSAVRQRLRPRGFMLAIIEKDGEVKQRRPAPRDVREINATIDKFPLRRQEMLDRRPSGRD